MNISRTINMLEVSSKIMREEEVIVVGLNSACDVFMDGAFLFRPAQKIADKLWWETDDPYINKEDENEIPYPQAVIWTEKGGTKLVKFHESRSEVSDGVTVKYVNDEFPFAVFFNCGKEKIFLDGEGVGPDKYFIAFSEKEADPQNPEVQSAINQFSQSPKVRASLQKVCRRENQKRQEQQKVIQMMAEIIIERKPDLTMEQAKEIAETVLKDLQREGNLGLGFQLGPDNE